MFPFVFASLCHWLLFFTAVKIANSVVGNNVTTLELPFSSSNDSVELMSSINMTANFLEAESGKASNEIALKINKIEEKNASLLETLKDPTPGMMFDYPELSSSLNKMLNPCDNFYEFVCRGWKVNSQNSY